MIRNFISFLLFLMLFSIKVFPQNFAVFEGDETIIGSSISYLEDPSNKMTIEEVKRSSEFKRSASSVPNMELSRSDFWLRFSIKNKSLDEYLILSIDFPALDICEFYSPYNGEYKVQRISDNDHFYKRKYKHQDFLFDVNLPKDSLATFYVRVQSSEQMVLPVILGTPQQIAESKLTKDLLWGGLIGVLVVMILYNVFVYISTKDISYLYYVSYAFFIGLSQITLSGYSYRFFFPNYPQWFNLGWVVFPGIAGIALSLFMRVFLQTKENAPILNKVISFIIILYGTTICFRVLGYDQLSYRLTDVAAMLITILVFVLCIALSMKGSRPAKIFLLAWSMFFLGVVLFVLRNLGILPYNSLTNYTMPAGTALEVTLLSLALADRINILKKEKEASQAESLAIAKENERIIRVQNVVLEEKVKERTVELEASNQELNTTLDDLKQAQIQLVESEKMASLGQLTAGIAHEINNPINFVTSNVAPLQRDVNILIDAISTMENLSMSGITVEEKQKQIEDYKEEIDYDYLKIEISHLLKGINEGASRTAEIVKGLRVFSRLDEDDLKIADIHEGIESTLVIANNLLNGIKVTKAYAELPRIECYPGKLNQVFLNIISNATHAIIARHGEGAGEGELKITTRADSESIYIHICDNGTGMDENTSKKMFEPFFTTKNVGEGTGLGMSIAYNTIKKHNGHIRVDSVLGKGTEFIIDLPIINKISET